MALCPLRESIPGGTKRARGGAADSVQVLFSGSGQGGAAGSVQGLFPRPGRGRGPPQQVHKLIFALIYGRFLVDAGCVAGAV